MIKLLKIENFFCRRKQDLMDTHNLFTLLTERLLLHAASLSMATYNSLFELLTESLTPEILYKKHEEPDPQMKFENSSQFVLQFFHIFDSI